VSRGWLIDTNIVSEWIKPRPDAGMVRWLDEVDEDLMIREQTSPGLAAARAEGRIGGRRKKLDAAKRPEIAESVISGRKIGAELVRLDNVSAPTVSRIVAEHRTG